MKLIDVVKTPNDSKYKLTATFKDDEGKIRKVNFGVKNSFSYIDGADDKIRNAYLARHAKDIINPDPTTKGNLSYYITWGPSKSLNQNVKLYKQRFNV
jgi:hypothetical protein